MARRFDRAAIQRFDDAQFLLSGSRTNAAVYLAGYSVECMMKALILSTSAPQQESQRPRIILRPKGSFFRMAESAILGRALFPGARLSSVLKGKHMVD
jgi:hypothetical protein